MKIQNSKFKIQNHPSSPPLEIITPPTPSYLKRGCRRRGRYSKGGMGGFTLIELVITMVIIGIIAYVVATAISTGVKGYFATDFRKEALDQARIAMERMTREIRNLRSSADVSATSNASQICFINTDGAVISFRYSANNIARQDTLASLAACPGAAGNTLATNITAFSFGYVSDTGAVGGAFVAGTTRRIMITITSTISNESVTLQSDVWPRSL